MINLDELFEKYFRNFLKENAGKFTEEELENKVSEIYENFGTEPLSELNGKSPKEYFSAMKTEELVKTVADCVNGGVPVSDFLCEEIVSRKDADAYLSRFVGTKCAEELAVYCVNLLSEMNSDIAFDKYVDILSDGSAGESLSETITEILSENADKVKEKILSLYGKSEKAKIYYDEILSKASADERIFAALCEEFRSHLNEIPVYSSYLAKYGDDRALPLLYEAIERKDISYLDFKELKIAIEALGGEYDAERDFKTDRFYKKLKGN
ncbi:MAG TPA: hypothetical protein DDW54_01125 [Clostridiales bacterium]|nr:hypothetical protein [Clostridiales bacterium]